MNKLCISLVKYDMVLHIDSEEYFKISPLSEKYGFVEGSE